MALSQVVKTHTTDKEIAAETLLQRPRAPLHLVLDNIRSAYNVGAAFRTADAAGLEKLYLCGISAYPPNKKVDKTALGTTTVVPWQYYSHTREAIAYLERLAIPICAVEVTNASVDLWEYAVPQPVALVFGHEVSGVDSAVLNRAQRVIQIPMTGRKNSLNVATAMGIVIFEVLRQWNGRK